MADDINEVSMPKLGESVTEGTLSSWLKQVGDTVAFDDPLFEVSTDKVDSEIPSPYDGTVLEILVTEGETVPVGTPLVRIGEATGGAAAGPVVSGEDEGVVTSPPSAPAGESYEVTMPKLGETVTEGTVNAW